MVYAFILHTVGSKDIQTLYYKIFTCYGSVRCNVLCERKSGDKDLELETNPDLRVRNMYKKTNELTQHVLFESLSEKKELVNYVSNKVHMHYSLKMKQALIPIASVENDSKISGVFRERNWKNELNEEFIVVWECVKGFGFTLLCKKNENIHQAHSVLDTVIAQAEKQIRLLSDPLIAVKTIETLALIINNFIPGGLLLFMNSKMLNSFEKKLKVDLYAK